jgi:hypothetical protein
MLKQSMIKLSGICVTIANSVRQKYRTKTLYLRVTFFIYELKMQIQRMTASKLAFSGIFLVVAGVPSTSAALFSE